MTKKLDAPNMGLEDKETECYVCKTVQKGVVFIDYGELFKACKKCLSIAYNIALGNILYKVTQMKDGKLQNVANALTFKDALTVYNAVGGSKNPLMFMSIDTGG